MLQVTRPFNARAGTTGPPIPMTKWTTRPSRSDQRTTTSASKIWCLREAGWRAWLTVALSEWVPLMWPVLVFCAVVTVCCVCWRPCLCVVIRLCAGDNYYDSFCLCTGDNCAMIRFVCVLETTVLWIRFVCVLETTLYSDSFCVCAGDNCAMIRFVCVLETTVLWFVLFVCWRQLLWQLCAGDNFAVIRFVCVLETTVLWFVLFVCWRQLCCDSFCLCAGDNCAAIRFVCVLETTLCSD